MKLRCWGFLLLVVTQITPVQAFYCGDFLIETGQYKQQVLKKCGQPESVDSHVEKHVVNLSAGITQFGDNGGYYPNNALNINGQQLTEVDVIVEQWLYNFGRNRFQQLLRFENGKLITIQELGYGN